MALARGPLGATETVNSLSRRKLPALTTEQMREVDRVMVEDLHIELVQMMENAGRGLAELAIDRFSPGRSRCWPGRAATAAAARSGRAIWPTAAARSRWCSPSRPPHHGARPPG